MKIITCYVRPHRLELVKTAIAAHGVTGLTVSDVRGTGTSPETSPWSQIGVVPLPIRSKIVVAVRDELLDELIEAIRECAWTGEPNDGKIFVEELHRAVRIRTEESDELVV